jgi:ribosomal protein L10
MKKKDLYLLKTNIFLKKYPIIVFLQHNNLKVKNWSQLRVNLKTKNNSSIFLFKNTIMETALCNTLLITTQLTTNSIQSLFQGPCFAFGCTNLDELKTLWNLINSTQNIIIIGGIYSNTILNHLDLEKLLNLDNTTYDVFVNIFNQKYLLYNSLQAPLSFNIFQEIQLNLISCLLNLKEKKKLEFTPGISTSLIFCV